LETLFPQSPYIALANGLLTKSHHQALMLDIRIGHDDVNSLPNLVFAIGPPGAALGDKALRDSRISN
jgi:hypothetical protein